MEIRLLSRPERPAAIQLIWAAFLRYEAPDYSPEGIEAFRRFITDEASWDRLESFGAFEGGQLCGVIAVREHRTHIALFFVAADRLESAAGCGITCAVSPRLQLLPSTRPLMRCRFTAVLVSVPSPANSAVTASAIPPCAGLAEILTLFDWIPGRKHAILSCIFAKGPLNKYNE